MTWTKPIKLTPITQSQSPGVINSRGPPQPTPALLQTRCTLPKTPNVSFAACCTDVRSATSHLIPYASIPWPLSSATAALSAPTSNIGQHHPHVCSTKGTRQGTSDAAFRPVDMRYDGQRRVLPVKG
jgi:hypothetical protein